MTRAMYLHDGVKDAVPTGAKPSCRLSAPTAGLAVGQRMPPLTRLGLNHLLLG